jgi:hypothetical protein
VAGEAIISCLQLIESNEKRKKVIVISSAESSIGCTARESVSAVKSKAAACILAAAETG